jgi:hypothetical protein
MSEPPAIPAPPVRGGNLWLKVLVVILLALLLLGVFWWWQNRPIQPVVLSVEEKAAVEAKVEAIQKPAEPTYEKGSREIVLTERELNGLLNENTDFGKSVSFQLATNAIHARVETDLDPDLPVVGGRRLKARARFLVSDIPGKASFILDDLTVWGVSLPNDWLAGLKGQDLLAQTLGSGNNGKVPGVEEFKVEPGQLIIRLKE